MGPTIRWQRKHEGIRQQQGEATILIICLVAAVKEIEEASNNSFL